MLVFLIVAGWLLCSVLTYGLVFAWLQESYPEWESLYLHKIRYYWEDVIISLLYSLLGPAGLVLFLYCEGTKHGVKFK